MGERRLLRLEPNRQKTGTRPADRLGRRSHRRWLVTKQKEVSMKRLLFLVPLVFLTGSNSGCGKCGPTSPGRTCVAYADKQEGVICNGLDCHPRFVEVCTEWRC